MCSEHMPLVHVPAYLQHELRDLRRQLAHAREALASARRNADAAAAAATDIFTGGLRLRPPRRGSGSGEGGRGIRALKRQVDALKARVEALQLEMQTSIIRGAWDHGVAASSDVVLLPSTA